MQVENVDGASKDYVAAVSRMFGASPESHYQRLARRRILPSGLPMKVCYCDESGTGNEPIAVMVGILVDAQRMHITKGHWSSLLEELSRIANRPIAEIHTRNFYRGNGIWRDLNAQQRTAIITQIFDWLCQRKHSVVYAAVHKDKYYKNRLLIPSELNTVWRFLGFHLVLAIQKYCSGQFSRPKGHTIFIFDNEKHEEARFPDLVLRPPAWSDEYYARKLKQEPLDQIVDVPYFGDSQQVALIQVADVAAFFLRRYAEINEGLVPEEYKGEGSRIAGWIKTLASLSVGRAHIYKQKDRCDAEDLFFNYAPASIRSLH
jgi:hypothetical protein